MTQNWFFKEQLRETLMWRSGLKPAQVEVLVDEIANKLDSKHLTVVPTYLSEEMYAAQLDINPVIPYNDANKMYVEAVKMYASMIPISEPDKIYA
jgi:hypothetical protein